MNTLYTYITGAVVIAGAAFYGGMQYQLSVQAKTDAARVAVRGERGFGARGQGGQPGQIGGRFTPTIGKVLSKDDTTIVVELEAGGSKIVLLSEATTVVHSEKSTLTEVKIGDNVNVMGATNPDGSLTAERIMTGDTGRMRTRGQ